MEVAKKIMFGQQQPDPAGDGSDGGAPAGRKGRNSRRETWCPGRSAWELPLAGAGAKGAGGFMQGCARSDVLSGTAGAGAHCFLSPYNCLKA